MHELMGILKPGGDCLVKANVAKDEVLTKMRLKTKFFKGFADTTRLIVFESLKDGEMTVTQLVERTGYGQSTISNHLACLKDCGLVKVRQEGRNNYYSLRDARVVEILNLAEDILSDVSFEMYNCLKY